MKSFEEEEKKKEKKKDQVEEVEKNRSVRKTFHRRCAPGGETLV